MVDRSCLFFSLLYNDWLVCECVEMMMRTHLLFGAVLALFFLPYMNHQLIFIFLVLFASLLPDVDSAHSYVGRSIFLRPLQWMMKHRGCLHSITFAFFVSFVLVLFLPVAAFPFFVGYAGHLLLDSFTVEGIRPWWPGKEEWKGAVVTGSNMESGLFYALILVGLGLAVVRFF